MEISVTTQNPVLGHLQIFKLFSEIIFSQHFWSLCDRSFILRISSVALISKAKMIVFRLSRIRGAVIKKVLFL